MTAATFLSAISANFMPVNVGKDGKQSDARTPFAFMSRMRSCTFQQPGRIWSYEVGSIPYSCGGRPTTAFKARLGICFPSKTQTSEPSFLRTTLGATE